MARIHGVVLLVVLALAWFVGVPQQAHAAVSVTEYCNTTDQPCGVELGWFRDRDAACTAAENEYKARNPTWTSFKHWYSVPTCSYCLAAGVASNYCTTGAGSGGPIHNQTYGTRVVSEDCPAGTVQQGNSCVSVCSLVAGQAPNYLTCTGASCTFYGNQLQREACAVPGGGSTGCVVSGDLDLAWGAKGDASTENEWYVRTRNNKFTGAPCSMGAGGVPDAGGETPAQQEAAQPDKAGKCPGEANGVPIWVPCTWTTSEKPKKDTTTTTAPDGTTTTTSNDGTSKTECKAGVCTTTTTTTVTASTNGSGTTTTTISGSSSVPESSYCKDNPTDPQCADSSGWGGSCSAGFQCKGDAVMCATAQAVWQQKCALIDGPAVPTAEQTAYTAAKGKPVSNGSAWSDNPNNETVTIGSTNFDSSNALGVSGQCIANRVVTVWHSTVTLPFSSICPHLESLRFILIAVAYLVAAIIVFRRS